MTKKMVTYSELDKYDNGDTHTKKSETKEKKNEFAVAWLPPKWIQIERTKELLNLKCISQIDATFSFNCILLCVCVCWLCT